MVNIITISIDRYNALYKRALQADALEKENAELREENELLKVEKVDLPDEVKFYDTPYGKVAVINGKRIKLKNGNIQLCNKSRKHYAIGGLTTKSELTDQSPFPMLKRSEKNK